MNLKIKNLSLNENPKYATDGSAGFDLRANLENDIIVSPSEYKVIPTGFYIEIPTGYMGMITPRSGLAAKYGISIVNSPGIIDCDYRGEIKIIIINHGKDDFIIHNSDKIAQMIISPYEKVKFDISDDFSDTERGAGGFGSSN